MYVEKILLKNFRNIKDVHLDLNPNFNFIIGNNGHGKTNFLESIYLLATARSHRTNIDREMVNWEKSEALTQIMLNKRDYKLKISLLLQGSKKTIKINNTPLEKISDLMGNLNVVLFSPEDLKLVKGSPANRREFLNLEVSQVNSYYHHILNEYNHILKQRNNLLKELQIKKDNKKLNMLDIWSEKLVEVGSKIIDKRLGVVDRLKILARLSQRKITNGKENLNISYETSLKGNIKKEDISVIFKNNLVNNRDKEIKRGYTLFGPHRADLKLKINDMDVRRYGSQGQQRTVALALKLAELEFMKSETGEYPVLLLDDVFSELDKKRRNTLLNTITDKIQTFITTTDLRDIKKFSPEKEQVFIVKNGKFEKGR
ncbi:MAG: DNA replication/repair protein RecF [Bacillota bacterium]